MRRGEERERTMYEGNVCFLKVKSNCLGERKKGNSRLSVFDFPYNKMV